jgi:undecaprenyl-diphosphatase
MDNLHAPPQPGSPERAETLLPLKSLGISLLIGALICIAGTSVFVWLADEVFENEFATADRAIITWLHSLWGPLSDQSMLFLTTMGGPVVLGIFVGLAALALWRRGRWIDAGMLVIGVASGALLNLILKAFYQRGRPDLFIGPFQLSSYSFPSGHAMGSMICYGLLTVIGVRLLRRPQHKLLLIAGATLLVLGIGLSRVYFGVHFPTDVLGGFVAGAIWLTISIQLARVAEWYAARRAAARSWDG